MEGRTGLVSGLYRLAPSDGYIDDHERERRVKVAVRRLLGAHGQDAMLTRIDVHLVTGDEVSLKARVRRVAEAQAALATMRAAGGGR